jgi:hypothetical protein
MRRRSRFSSRASAARRNDAVTRTARLAVGRTAPRMVGTTKPNHTTCLSSDTESLLSFADCRCRELPADCGHKHTTSKRRPLDGLSTASTGMEPARLARPALTSSFGLVGVPLGRYPTGSTTDASTRGSGPKHGSARQRRRTGPTDVREDGGRRPGRKGELMPSLLSHAGRAS